MMSSPQVPISLLFGSGKSNILQVEPEVVHHGEYYLQDGVIFLVENTLFKVPRYRLVNESPVFADMFRIPTMHAEGQTDAAPIQLLQVTSTDFTRLLIIVYPLTFGPPETKLWEESEWTSVLHLATRWQMSEVRKMTIAQLTECAKPVTKVRLGRLYDHPPWVREGFCGLCLRNKPLNWRTAEAEQLSKTDILKIGVARERIRTEVLPSRHEVHWTETKYGMATVTFTRYPGRMQYSKNRALHVILDEVFDLVDTPEDFDGDLTNHSICSSPATEPEILSVA